MLPEPSPVQVPVRGASVRLAAVLVVGAIAVVVGVALLGRGGDRPAGLPTALEGPTSTPMPDLTPGPTAVRTASSVETASSAARELGLPFDFGSHDLCAWFSPEEITEIVADAYREHGGEIVPGPFRRLAGPAGCEGWIADYRGGLVQLYPGPESSIADLPLQPRRVRAPRGRQRRGPGRDALPGWCLVQRGNVCSPHGRWA